MNNHRWDKWQKTRDDLEKRLKRRPDIEESVVLTHARAIMECPGKDCHTCNYGNDGVLPVCGRITGRLLPA